MTWRFVALALLFSLSPPLSTRLGAQAADPDGIEPGNLVLDLSPDAVSSLGMDVAGLTDWLCDGGPEPEPDRGGGSSEDCRLVVGGAGSQNRSSVLTLRISAAQLRAQGAGATATARVTQLHLPGAEPVTTPCGAWLFEARLVAGLRQPGNTLVLEEAAPEALTGLFVGTVELAAELVLTREEDSTTEILPLPLELDLGGRWLALPTANVEQGTSTLALFLDLDGHDFVDRPGCAQDRQRCGRLCLTASEGTVDAANGLVP
ncbi:MAG TPA: hypothetical protein VF017_19040 [Thermoanaerobaculia bacterium]|nr:hypothetical protein [Thermoanaerobaculia bacterium]